MEFNSTTMKGRANVAKATLAGAAAIGLYFYMKGGNAKVGIEEQNNKHAPGREKAEVRSPVWFARPPIYMYTLRTGYLVILLCPVL